MDNLFSNVSTSSNIDKLNPTRPTSIWIYMHRTRPPPKDEVAKVIKTLKNNKSPGIDEISVELLKALPDLVADELHSLITEIWDNDCTPDERKTSIIAPIFKKADRKDCKNDRGISLIPLAAILFAIIILNIFRDTRNRQTQHNEARFRPCMGFCNQIFSLRQILEHRCKQQRATIQILIDFITDFDSIHCDAIWEAMKEDRVLEKTIHLTRANYAGRKV
ncbi:hypothetical protein QYM36_005862 [Artemia franciscana]|uniref:Reverse transcriptase domain-containing protein n=1 Tax=Artemia franciscana TaxID=6661 RepID=A0AA88I0G0_ARTSF|nr:hypothetical protein QYM36_005862 [Artemia franciscana]